MELASGNIFEFRGTSDAEMTELSRTASSDMAAIQQNLNDLGIDNAVVTAGELGLTISLEDIRFEADSALLLDSEKAKLRAIADILSAYSGSDLLITGHTARAGSRTSQMELSEERAASVGGYLVELGVRDQYHVFTRGVGADEPVADNSTEEGRARNRRVEITILEK
jgi:outer membrane protein OmpA-like peptidoglycan-associated protein